jgi:VWFA-related protein
MRPSSLVLAAVAIGYSAAALPTQTSQFQAQSSVPAIRSETRAVVVDVVVTKGLDQPVGGLHKQDFQLLEDRKPQNIDFFEEHTAVQAPSDIQPAPNPPNVYTNVPTAPASDSVNILLLDLLNTDSEDQGYVRRQIVKYLNNKPQSARVAIFALSTKLEMIEGFTADSSALRNSLDAPQNVISTGKTPASQSKQQKQGDLEDVQNLEAIHAGAIAIEQVKRAQAALASYRANDRVQMTLEALQNLARYLSAIPGRKNLIWFSGSFPISVFPGVNQKQFAGPMRHYSAAIKGTADLLALSKIAVYPVDAGGLVGEHLMGAGNTGPPDGQGSASGNWPGAGFSQGQVPGSDPDSGGHSGMADKMAAMQQLAADTGGDAILNTNDLATATARAIDNGAHYYTIVYTPTSKKMDGQYRRIEVKLAERNYKLSYRRGYYADEMENAGKSAALPDIEPAHLAGANSEGMADPLHQLMTRGMPSSTQILYGVRVLPATPQPAPTARGAGYNAKLPGPITRYTVDFLIDWDKVLLQPGTDGSHTGTILIEILAYDRDGNILNGAGQTMRMSLDAKTFASVRHSAIPAHLEIDLPQTNIYLATGIYDLKSNKAGTLEIPFDTRVGPKTQAAVARPPK